MRPSTDAPEPVSGSARRARSARSTRSARIARIARTTHAARVALLVHLAGAAFAGPASAQLDVRAENPIALDRPDETVAVAWDAVRRALPSAGAARVRVVDAGTGAELLSQALDADGDGAVDSLLFVAGFRPMETRRFRVEARPPTVTAPRVFVMHQEERDDVAWESDRIAYRTYGQGLWGLEDLRSSGMDVWLKRVPDLVIERWYAAGHDSYHVDTGEGADFFTVGPSLGAGGTAVWNDGTMYRALNFRSHRIIANGPVRVVFELTYDPWDAGGLEVSEVKRISIDAGQNLFRQESTFTGPSAPFAVVAGTVKRDGLVGSMRRGTAWSWLSTWGPVELPNGGHGRLGTGLLIPDDRLVRTRETGDHYLVETSVRSGEPLVLYTGAGWTASGQFDGVEDWWAYLDGFARRLANPIRVEPGR